MALHHPQRGTGTRIGVMSEKTETPCRWHEALRPECVLPCRKRSLRLAGRNQARVAQGEYRSQATWLDQDLLRDELHERCRREVGQSIFDSGQKPVFGYAGVPEASPLRGGAKARPGIRAHGGTR